MCHIQSRQKQSADGQAVTVVRWPIIHARSVRQNFGLFFSSQEALSLHFSFKLEVTINALLYRKFSHTEHKSMRAHLLTYPAAAIKSVNEITQRPNAELRLSFG